jgi:hypothetical protein
VSAATGCRAIRRSAPPASARTECPIWSAVRPALPDPSKIASNSALLRTPAPRSMRRSRGRSDRGNSLIVNAFDREWPDTGARLCMRECPNCRLGWRKLRYRLVAYGALRRFAGERVAGALLEGAPLEGARQRSPGGKRTLPGDFSPGSVSNRHPGHVGARYPASEASALLKGSPRDTS